METIKFMKDGIELDRDSYKSSGSILSDMDQIIFCDKDGNPTCISTKSKEPSDRTKEVAAAFKRIVDSREAKGL